MSAERSVPSLPVPGLPAPRIVGGPATPQAMGLAVPVLPNPVAPVVSVAPDVPTLPPAKPAVRTTNWKPIQRSKARKALNGVIGVAVLAALAGGAWFAYRSLAPADDTTTPTTLLIDNPDTFIGQANQVVQDINATAPDQELLDLVGAQPPEPTVP